MSEGAATPAGARSQEDLAPLDTASMTLAQAFKAYAVQKGKTDVNEFAARLALMILRYAVKEAASDVHFAPHGDSMLVRFRIDGMLRDQLAYAKTDFPITARLRVMAGFSPQASTSYTPEDGRFQFALEGRMVQFRVSAFPTTYGDKLVLRVLDTGRGALDLDNLGFFPEVLDRLQSLIRSPSGILFVAGLTGGGKTTTLCSILSAINKSDINIVTLEDPVEYELPRVIHSQINTKAGFTFADGLRSILRQDPNVIMVGEVRDTETAEIALRAAMTGHLIFSTVHATTATGVVHRLLSMGVEPYMISSALIGALAQRLVRRVCRQCAEPASPTLDAVESMVRYLEPAHATVIRDMLARPGARFLRGRGCHACSHTGYKGRVGIFELLVVNDRMRELVSAKADVVELRKQTLAQGMRTLLMDAVEKAWLGVTTLDEVVKAVTQI